MTCIVGFQGSDHAWIGGDSAAVDAWGIVKPTADAKVFRVGRYLYGVAGSFRMMDVLRWGFVPPEPPPCGFIDLYRGIDRFMRTAYVDALRVALKEAGYSRKTEEVDSLGQGSFLVAVDGRLYEVDSDYQIGRNSEGVYALGIGYQLALGAISAVACDAEGGDRVTLALRVASRWSGSVCEPFTVLESRQDA